MSSCGRVSGITSILTAWDSLCADINLVAIMNKTIATICLLISLGLATPARGDLFRDIGIALGNAGFTIAGDHNILSGGDDFFVGRNARHVQKLSHQAECQEICEHQRLRRRLESESSQFRSGLPKIWDRSASDPHIGPQPLPCCKPTHSLHASGSGAS